MENLGVNLPIPRLPKALYIPQMYLKEPVADVPAWTTAAGSLGTVDAAGSISFTVAATDATSYAVTSGSLPGGGSLNTSTGAITGTESGSTDTTTYNFTITATDAQGQTAARAFSITVNHGISNSVRMDP